jgi:hypothetical protein
MPDHYVIEVTLRGIRPRIWRRFTITAQAMFLDLHEAIQDACGWRHAHPFQFKSSEGRVLAGLPDGPDDVTTPEARINPIEPVFATREGRKLLYVYDFGDRWEHDVEVVDVLRGTGSRLARKLLAGERAFPPEDCGGLAGYGKCLEISLSRKKDPGRKRRLAGWHPEKFSIREAARALNAPRLSRRARYRKSSLPPVEET